MASALIFTQIAIDNFNRPNENPLNPEIWSDGGGDVGPCEIVGELCVPSVDDGGTCLAYYIGAAFPADQYSEFTVIDLGSSSSSLCAAELILRASLINIFQGYECTFTNNGNGTMLIQASPFVEGAPEQIIDLTVPFNFGDTFRFACVGTNFYLYQNGKLIGTAIDSTYDGLGIPGFFLDGDPDLTNGGTAINHWAAGSVIAGGPQLAFSPAVIEGTAFLVPLQPTPQTLTITLGGVSYQLTVRWNDINQAWSIDIADSLGNPILQGIPMVTGRDLLEPFGYLDFGGMLFAQTTTDTYAVPTFTNLGTTGNLYFIVAEAEEEAASNAASGGTPVTVFQTAYDETPTGTIDGVNTIFTLVNSPNPPTSLDLRRNNGGQTQQVGASTVYDYTLVGNVITFVIPPQPADGNQPAETILARFYTY